MGDTDFGRRGRVRLDVGDCQRRDVRWGNVHGYGHCTYKKVCRESMNLVRKYNLVRNP